MWLSFLFLIVGIAITFYLPRRRVWARLAPDGELRLVARADRYVDLRREFGDAAGDLVARRHRARLSAAWPRLPGPARGGRPGWAAASAMRQAYQP